MQSLLLLIPVLVFLGLGALLLRRGWAQGIGGAFLRALVLSGLIASFMIEILSPLHAITPLGLGLGWALIGAAVAVVWVRSPSTTPSIHSWLPVPQPPKSRVERVSLVIVALALLLTGIVAWRTPPQTWDSLNYHMPRVAHWAQQGSVEHFATGVELQNSRTPGGEYLLLQVYVLTAGDRLVPLVGWFAFLASMVAAGQIGRQFLPRAGWVSAAALAALPTAIIQASSTVNDIIVGLWVIVCVREILMIGVGDSESRRLVFLGGVAGLALLAKPTSAAYLLPLAVWAGFRLGRSFGMHRVFVGLASGAVLILGLNLPYLLRNNSTYGQPIQEDQIQVHGNELYSPAALVSNVLRNAVLNASTPIPALNKAIFLSVSQVHQWIGLSTNDPRTTTHEPFRIHSFSTHEERSGNLIAATLVLVTLIWMLRRRESLPTGMVGLALAGISCFLLLSILFKWQVFSARYQLPFFMMWGPVTGCYIASRKGWRSTLILVFLFVGSIPWLISIRSRPLLPIPGEVSAPSVLLADRQTLLFTNGEYLEEPYVQLANEIEDADCGVVGISISGSSAEYPLWVLLGAPRDDLEVQWVVSDTPSARYLPPEFSPCAVICQDCDQDGFRGLPITDQIGGYSLYLSRSE